LEQVVNHGDTSVQSRVTEFYDNLVFPSRSSHPEYEALVPSQLHGKRVADFGCGQSLFINAFRRYGYEAIFLDISPNVVKQIDYGTAICASLTEIPLDNDYIDTIFCIGVVHHIPEMEKAIQEIIRVLRPGGTLYLGVYAPRTAQALLRSWFDRSRTPLRKRTVSWLARQLIWLKNRKNGLSSHDLCKRVDDLLITPVVRYIDVQQYDTIIMGCGASIVNVSRISQMNILTVTK
jgi:SAM-dependent methyltransferase